MKVERRLLCYRWSADRDALISCFTKWPFFLKKYLDIIIILSVSSAPCRLVPFDFLFIYLFNFPPTAHSCVRACVISLLVSLVPLLLPPPSELRNHIPHLFGFSYAMVKGTITSWREASRQLEAPYLWQLLSNCCFWTVNPPPQPPHPHWHPIGLPL